MTKRLREQWPILAPTSLTLMLGLWGLGTPAPWGDEQVTVDAVHYPLHHLWELPLMPYYGAVWTWSLMGALDDIAWLRLFSVLCMTAATTLVAMTARRLAGAKAAVSAGVIFALAPLVQRYSQEARVYALATVLVALATWLLTVAVADPRRRWWIGYALALAAAAIFFPLSLAVIPAHAVILTSLDGWRQRLKPWLISCLALTPLVVVLVWMSRQYGFMHSTFEPPGFEALLGAPGIVLGSTFGIAVIALGLTTRQGMRWVLGTITGVSAIAIVSWVSTSWWLERSFKPLTTLLAIAAGIALAKVGRNQVIAVLVLFSLVALPELRAARQPDARGEDGREIATIMDREGQQGDLVLIDPERLPWWSVEQILKDGERFERTEVPVDGRYWELLADPTCTEYQEWDIVGQRPLRLCNP